MGIGLFGSWKRNLDWRRVAPDLGSSDQCDVKSPLLPGDPNPSKFIIQRACARGDFVVAEVVWPDAKNFEGRKIALYRATLTELAAATLLDPHFSEQQGPLVPIARFEPTEAGWAMALKLVEIIS